MFEYQYLVVSTKIPKDTHMHDLKAIYDKVWKQVRLCCKDQHLFGDNFNKYPNPPKMSDLEIISLAITAECLSIDSENLLWSKIKSDYPSLFPNLIHRTNFNRRRKQLEPFISKCSTNWSMLLNEGEDQFIVDSIPIPICKIAREYSSTVCRRKQDEVPANKGYHAIDRGYYIGYKLHLCVSKSGVYNSMVITPASAHDVTIARDLVETLPQGALVIGDKGYISHSLQLELFKDLQVQLEVPFRKNQHDHKPYDWHKKVSRKRIETTFSQYVDAFNLKKNYTKSFEGLFSRINTKIAAMTFKQYWNLMNGKKVSCTKHALAA